MPRNETPATEVPEVLDAELAPSAAVSPPVEGYKKAVVVAGGSSIPDADLKVVVESRKYSGGVDDVPLTSEPKKSHYPAGADLYIRYDTEVQFPKDAPEILTVGVDVQQHNFWGFTRQLGSVNVGPAHAAYVGANLAYQRGATHIDIVGLTDGEKERLKPFFDRLPTDPVEPAQVVVSLL